MPHLAKLRGILAAALAAALLLPLGPASAQTRVAVGVDLPKSGIDGADGLALREAVRLAGRDLAKRGVTVAFRDAASATPVRNPHQDEGSDNDADVAAAPKGISSLGSADVRVSVGPLRSNVAFAELLSLAQYDIAAVTPAAGLPSRLDPLVFHLAPSDRQLVDAAYARMTATYGKNLCILDDGTVEGRARARLMLAHAPNVQHLTVPQQARNPLVVACITSVDVVFLAARNLMLFTGPRVANRLSIAHLLDQTFRRDFDLARIGSRFGAVYQPIAAPLARSPRLESVARAYHAAAKTVPSDDALRAYAAVEIAAAAAKTAWPRRTIQNTNFDTVIGRVAFDKYGDRLGAPIAIKKL